MSARALLLVGLLAVATTVGAHEVRPGFLELRQSGDATWEVTWKVPTRGDSRLALDPLLPASCSAIADRSSIHTPGALVERWTVECSDGLAGQLTPRLAVGGAPLAADAPALLEQVKVSVRLTEVHAVPFGTFWHVASCYVGRACALLVAAAGHGYEDHQDRNHET